MMKTIWVAAGGAAAMVVAFIAWIAVPAGADEPAAPGIEAGPVATWCASSLERLEGDACFAQPRDPGGPVPLVVYLHGRYDDATANEELDRQARLAKLATSRGFAVLALHGVRGECSSADYKDYFCWPSNEHNEADAPAFAARAADAIARVRERLGDGPNVLLGFSNGGYFASLIAARGLGSFRAIAVAHGGPAGELVGGGPPMLLVTADDDAADPEMRKLDAELSTAGWPHVLVAREGGHALPDWDLDVVLTFFQRTLAKGFPFTPALGIRSERLIRDAGAEVAADGGVDLGDFGDGGDD
ncbi:MAG TPA: PHB depolymerase family esterase [Polyangiaceae bacterium]|jgi:poly(3-hydroxybutyrate) depolymerase